MNIQTKYWKTKEGHFKARFLPTNKTEEKIFENFDRRHGEGMLLDIDISDNYKELNKLWNQHLVSQ